MFSVIKNYCVPLEEEVMNKLMEKTNAKSHKDALTIAVLHYLECPCAGRKFTKPDSKKD